MSRPQGFRWLIRLPDEESPASPQNAPGSPQTAEILDHGAMSCTALMRATRS